MAGLTTYQDSARRETFAKKGKNGRRNNKDRRVKK